MPRDRIDLTYSVDYLSILDERTATWIRTSNPNCPTTCLLHRAMLLGRRFDERMLRLQRQVA
jgi:pyruvate dehydrogenase E1 component alpha subunit